MLLSPSNFILLDEPTNHLDMRAKDVLLESLEEYTGTVVLVSHDRYFIDKLATRVFEIGNGEVTVFPGNYEDYLWRKSGKPLDLPAADLGLTLKDVPGYNGAPAASEKVKRVNPMKVQKLKDRCTAIEGEIEKAEAEIAALEAELGNFKSTEETVRISHLADTRRGTLTRLLTEWEQLSQELEAAGSPVG
jgi:ATP-binding cassette, subfamily F, member 3